MIDPTAIESAATGGWWRLIVCDSTRLLRSHNEASGLSDGYADVDESRQARIEDLTTRISQWQRVHDHEVSEIRDDNSRFKTTMAIAAKVVAAGSIPSFLKIAHWSFLQTPEWIGIGPFTTFLCASFGLTVSLAAAARASGLLAYFWFRRDAGRQRLAVYFIAMAAAATILGWILVLTS